MYDFSRAGVLPGHADGGGIGAETRGAAENTVPWGGCFPDGKASGRNYSRWLPGGSGGGGWFVCAGCAERGGDGGLR